LLRGLMESEDAGEVTVKEGEDAKEGAAQEEGIEVPQDLSLLYFLDRTELADCTVRLAGGGGKEAEDGAAQFRCHKLALCAGSGYFLQKFLADGASPSDVELPELPQDEELRRQVDVAALFPLVLRYLYGSQAWAAIEAQVTPENAMGLFVLGSVLDIRTLAKSL